MRIVDYSDNFVKLRGYGYEQFAVDMGADPSDVSFTDYGLTLKVKNGKVTSCVFHRYDRGVDIEYFE